jgi:predicted kinase
VAGIHLIIGSTGAGKTTYAQNLAQERSAVRFAIDEWMNKLFFPDLKSDIEYQWAMERIHRCEEMIWSMAERVLNTHVDVILEVSASTRELRQKQLQRALDIGAAVQLHFLDVDKEIRRKRVANRNKDKGDSYSFEVTDEMFDFVEDMFERPGQEELSGAIIITE